MVHHDKIKSVAFLCQRKRSAPSGLSLTQKWLCSEEYIDLFWGLLCITAVIQIQCKHLLSAKLLQPGSHPKPNAHHFQAPIHNFLHIWQIIIVIIIIKQTLKTDKFNSHQSRIQILYLYTQKCHVTTSMKIKGRKHHHVIQMSVFTIKCSKISVYVV